MRPYFLRNPVENCYHYGKELLKYWIFGEEQGTFEKWTKKCPNSKTLMPIDHFKCKFCHFAR
jgi:hypothetical protein